MASPGPDDLAHLAPTPEWEQALRETPRHLFIPDRAWTVNQGLIDRTTDSDTWWATVYTDDAIVTQIDDGNTELTNDSPWATLRWSSSNSAPNMVFAFLDLLDPYPGDRVLEIGTGTGWTTGLLSAHLGVGHITSVEVDDQVSKQAAANLERAGYAPNLVVGDGAEGWPDRAPYDRVHVTCGVREVPYAWIEQTRPGGVIVAPWAPDGSGGHKLRLVVANGEAVGRFHGNAAYMLLRAQRPELLPIRGEARESTARVDPRRIARAGRGFEVALAGLMPGVSAGGSDHPGGEHRYALRHLPSDSHALAVRESEGGEVEVTQRGPRDLWDEVEAAYLAWVGWGQPERGRFGVTVDASGQHVWLDTPDNRIREMVV
ncbi:methyltransferase domain-containing protein [Halostreptopolyspora alba]|uniref:Protein-L-isoaspartate O-methyltransferase n=1 Tax=Halostreptopolyspora alba TaxID=2487137 RepID=A0A3N0E1V3_9ACTN|nr:methyltransferase domain-containing protein [Nocardiopsaceae bacterium YIM 96095]